MSTTNITAQIKMANSVNDSSLAKRDELVFSISPVENLNGRYNQVDITSSDGQIVLRIIGDGNFTNADRDTNLGNEKTIDANSSEAVYFSNGTYLLTIGNKFSIQKLVFNTTEDGGNYKNIKCDIAQFRGMADLTDLQIVGLNASGNCRALESNTALANLGLDGTSVYGDTNALSAALPSLAPNSSLPKTETNVELVFDIKDAADNKFTISAAEGNLALDLSEGFFFTNADGSANTGMSKIIIAGNEETVFIKGSGNGTLSIKNAQFVKTLVIDDNMSSAAFDLSQIANMPNLIKFTYFNNWDVYGDIAGLRGSKNLEWIDISSTFAGGDISVFYGMSQLKHLNISKTGIGGDIRYLAGLTNLETLILSASGAHGTCLSLRRLTSLKRLDIDSVAVIGAKFWQTACNTDCIVNGSESTVIDDDISLDRFIASIVDASGQELIHFDEYDNVYLTGNIYAANISGEHADDESAMASLIDVSDNVIAKFDNLGNLHIAGNVYASNGADVVRPANTTYLWILCNASGDEIASFDSVGNLWIVGNLHAANFGTIVPGTEVPIGSAEGLYPRTLSVMVDEDGNEFASFDLEGNLHITGNLYAANVSGPNSDNETKLAILLDADENEIAFFDEFGNLHVTGNVNALNLGNWRQLDDKSYLSCIVDSAGAELMNFDEFGNLNVVGNIYAANI